MINQRKITAGFLASLIILAVIILLSNSFISQFTLKDNEESYAFNLILSLDELVGSLRDERAAQRLYLESGDQLDLESFRNSFKNVGRKLTILHDLIREKPHLQKDLSDITLLIQRRNEVLAQSIENRRRDPASRILFNEILDHVNKLKAHTHEELKNASATQRKYLLTIRLIMILNSIAVAFLFGVIFALLRKDIARRALDESKLKLHRDQLDELVLQRTKELVTANQLLQMEMEERRRAEDSLHKLTEHMEMLREEERLAISRDIHDEIGQSLAALKLDLAWMKHSFSPGDSVFIDRLNTMKVSLENVIGKVQNIISELRPPLLDSLGICDAIEWQAQEFRRRNGMECHLSLVSRFSHLEEKVATAIMRILMEALMNVSRHAQATKVDIYLGTRGENLVLEISDNGCGIAPENISATTSYGLMGMHERARLCNGSLTITGVPGHGTTVCLSIPQWPAREKS